MFFDSWAGLFRVLVVGILAYAALILFLRFSGKRTLAKLNAFDLVVTVALGSILSSILLNKSVALFEGLLALALLILLQFAISWLSVRSKRFSELIRAEPTLLLYNGEFVSGAMRQQRVTREDLLSAIRAQGAGDVATISAVVLETDGSMSVVRNAPESQASLVNVSGFRKNGKSQD